MSGIVVLDPRAEDADVDEDDLGRAEAGDERLRQMNALHTASTGLHERAGSPVAARRERQTRDLREGNKKAAPCGAALRNR